MNDEEPDHGHGSPASGSLLLKVVNVASEDDSNDHMAGGHADRANDEDRLASDAIDPQNGRNSCELLVG